MLYDSLLETAAIHETVFFKSDEGKKLAKEISNICREIQAELVSKFRQKSFGSRVRMSFEDQWGKEHTLSAYNKIKSKVKGKFDACWFSGVITTTYYTQYGTAGSIDRAYCVGLYKHRLYKVTFTLAATGGTPVISEYELGKFDIDEEVVKYALNNVDTAPASTDIIKFGRHRLSNLSKASVEKMVRYGESSKKYNITPTGLLKNSVKIERI